MRIPRPMGITQMVSEIHKVEDTNEFSEKKNILVTYVINQWLLGNMSLCGIKYSSNELAIFLGVTTDVIQGFLVDKMVGSKLFDSNNTKSLLEGMMGVQVNWLMEDRMQISNQFDILARSQGDNYAAFISSEVNKALKLKVDNTNSLQSLIKTLMGGSGTTINVLNQNNLEQNTSILSREEAFEIAANAYRNTSDYALPVKEKFMLDIPPDLPIVNAIEQGIAGTNETIKSLTKEELLVLEDYKMHVHKKDKKDHQNRRQQMLLLDEEDIDPEFEEYDGTI